MDASKMFIYKFLFFILISLKFTNGQQVACNTAASFTATGQRYTIQWPEQQNLQASCEYFIVSPVDTYMTVRMAYDLSGSGSTCYDQYIRVVPDGNAQYYGSSTLCGFRASSSPLQFNTVANELRILIRSSDYARKVQIVIDTYAVTQSTCTCGVSSVGKVANGYDTNALEFTGHVAFKAPVNRYDECFCGGSLITQYHVLSAAHCVTEIERYGTGNVKMHVARQNINLQPSADTAYAAIYNIRYTVKHPNYNPDTNANDIGIVVPTTYIRLNKAVIPVCLPFAWRDYTVQTGTTLVSIGFGATEFARAASNDPKSWILQSARVKVDSSLSPCNQDTSKICARGEVVGTGRSDTCQRDSGGGVYGSVNGFYNIFGITSEGDACGLMNSYSINVYVPRYLSWIEGVVGSFFMCRK